MDVVVVVGDDCLNPPGDLRADANRISWVLEQRADMALEKLRLLASPDATVVRDGQTRRIKALEVVPGDILALDEGDIVAADGSVLPEGRLTIDESTLTGESIPVEKSSTQERCRVLAGTLVLAGSGFAIVEQTGRSTEYGRIGHLMAERTASPAPIEGAIRRLVVQVGIVVVALCVGLALLGVARGNPWPSAIIAAVSLAMAAIPEELPMVYTLYLALGAWRLAQNHALVRRLACVETLGTTTIICVDKTGTLTYGRIELHAMEPLAGIDEKRLIATARAASAQRVTDPLDAAIVTALSADRVARPEKILYEEPFDPRRNYAVTIWQDDDTRRIAVKGAFEAVADLCKDHADSERALAAKHDALAASGMRVLAVAEGVLNANVALDDHNAWKPRIIGFLSFADAVRPTVAAALEECRRAGIAVAMVTGDHAATAGTVARELGFGASADDVVTGPELNALSDEELVERLRDVRVFARIRPEQKLRIVSALRAAGNVVAMTGDGTNDALALREADIGIAMGKRGTEVARAAADLILLDDAFETIVAAVRNGRRIFDNLTRAVRYLVAFHIPLLVSAIVLPIMGAPLLLLPIHLVWLEIIVHPTSSLVFESDPGDPKAMQRPPRNATRGLLARYDWIESLIRGTTLALATLALYLTELSAHTPVPSARAAAITAMIVGQLALVIVEDARGAAFWRLTWTRTLVVILGGSLAMLIACIYVPLFAHAMNLAPLAAHELLIAVATGLVGCLAVEFIPGLKTAWRSA
jgi:Ca2+-transporting ATPase